MPHVTRHKPLNNEEVPRSSTQFLHSALRQFFRCFLSPRTHSLIPTAVPPDVLELLPDGYVYADYPGVFEEIEGDGLTFETWIYMTERPKEKPNGLVTDGQWIVFAKLGSYYATISARTLTDGFDRTRPKGTV